MRYRFGSSGSSASQLWTVSAIVMALATGCSKKPPAAADAGTMATTAPTTAAATVTATTKAPEDTAKAPEDTAPAAAPEVAAAETVPPAADAAAGPSDPEVAPAEVVAPAAPAPVWTLEGFAMPESVFYDAAADMYYVSNINGTDVVAKDDDGFISKVGPDGKLVELKWIDGAKDSITLNAPKGMAVADGVLWVADIDRLQGFDLKTGAPTTEVALTGATFMNDVVAFPAEKAGDPSCLLATDSGIKLGAKGPEDTATAAIWKVCGKEATKVASGEGIGHPNGITLLGKDIAFVGFDATKRIALKDLKFVDSGAVPIPVGQLDGLEQGPDGVVLVSSWEDGGVHKVFPDKHTEAFVKGLKGPADFAFDAKRKLVVVPLLMEGKVQAYAL